MPIKKYVIVLHRWMGVCLCLLFLMWFLSGMVLMYCDYPSVSEQSRLQHLVPLDGAKVGVTPEIAAEQAGVSAPEEVKLSSILSRPIYRFRSGWRIAVVYADSG
jgi:hypothetical protein